MTRHWTQHDNSTGKQQQQMPVVKSYTPQPIKHSLSSIKADINMHWT